MNAEDDTTLNLGIGSRKRKSTSRRSSILKIRNVSPPPPPPPAPREVLVDIDPNAALEEDLTVRRKSRRVSFCDTYQVKEFAKDSPRRWLKNMEDSAENEKQAPGSSGETESEIKGLDILLTGQIQQVGTQVQSASDPEEPLVDGRAFLAQLAVPSSVPAIQTPIYIPSSYSEPIEAIEIKTMANTSVNKYLSSIGGAIYSSMPVTRGATATSSQAGDATCVYVDDGMDTTRCRGGGISRFDGNTAERTYSGWDTTETRVYDADAAAAQRRFHPDRTRVFVGDMTAAMDLTHCLSPSLNRQRQHGYSDPTGCGLDRTQVYGGGVGGDMDFTLCHSELVNPVTTTITGQTNDDQVDGLAFLQGLTGGAGTRPKSVLLDTPERKSKSVTSIIFNTPDKIDGRSFLSTLMGAPSVRQNDIPITTHGLPWQQPTAGGDGILGDATRSAGVRPTGIVFDTPDKIDGKNFLSSLSHVGRNEPTHDVTKPKGIVFDTPDKIESKSFLSSLFGAQTNDRRQETPVDCDGTQLASKSFLQSLISSGGQPGAKPKGGETMASNQRVADGDRNRTVSGGSDAMDLTMEITETNMNLSTVAPPTTRPGQEQGNKTVMFRQGSDDMDFTCAVTQPVTQKSAAPKKSANQTVLFGKDSEMELTCAVTTDLNVNPQNTANKTVMFDNGSDMEFTCAVSTDLSAKRQGAPQNMANKTVMFDNGSDMEFTCAVSTDLSAKRQDALQNTANKTVMFDRGSDMEFTCVVSTDLNVNQQSSQPDTAHKTVIFDDDPDMEFTCEVSTNLGVNRQSAPQHAVNKTVIFDQDPDMEFTCAVSSVLQTEQDARSSTGRALSAASKASPGNKTVVFGVEEDMEPTCVVGGVLEVNRSTAPDVEATDGLSQNAVHPSSDPALAPDSKPCSSAPGYNNIMADSSDDDDDMTEAVSQEFIASLLGVVNSPLPINGSKRNQFRPGLLALPTRNTLPKPPPGTTRTPQTSALPVRNTLPQPPPCTTPAPQTSALPARNTLPQPPSGTTRAPQTSDVGLSGVIRPRHTAPSLRDLGPLSTKTSPEGPGNVTKSLTVTSTTHTNSTHNSLGNASVSVSPILSSDMMLFASESSHLSMTTNLPTREPSGASTNSNNKPINKTQLFYEGADMSMTCVAPGGDMSMTCVAPGADMSMTCAAPGGDVSMACVAPGADMSITSVANGQKVSVSGQATILDQSVDMDHTCVVTETSVLTGERPPGVAMLTGDRATKGANRTVVFDLEPTIHHISPLPAHMFRNSLSGSESADESTADGSPCVTTDSDNKTVVFDKTSADMEFTQVQPVVMVIHGASPAIPGSHVAGGAPDDKTIIFDTKCHMELTEVLPTVPQVSTRSVDATVADKTVLFDSTAPGAMDLTAVHESDRRMSVSGGAGTAGDRRVIGDRGPDDMEVTTVASSRVASLKQHAKDTQSPSPNTTRLSLLRAKLDVSGRNSGDFGLTGTDSCQASPLSCMAGSVSEHPSSVSPQGKYTVCKTRERDTQDMNVTVTVESRLPFLPHSSVGEAPPHRDTSVSTITDHGVPPGRRCSVVGGDILSEQSVFTESCGGRLSDNSILSEDGTPASKSRRCPLSVDDTFSDQNDQAHVLEALGVADFSWDKSTVDRAMLNGTSPSRVGGSRIDQSQLGESSQMDRPMERSREFSEQIDQSEIEEPFLRDLTQMEPNTSHVTGRSLLSYSMGNVSMAGADRKHGSLIAEPTEQLSLLPDVGMTLHDLSAPGLLNETVDLHLGDSRLRHSDQAKATNQQPGGVTLEHPTSLTLEMGAGEHNSCKRPRAPSYGENSSKRPRAQSDSENSSKCPRAPSDSENLSKRPRAPSDSENSSKCPRAPSYGENSSKCPRAPSDSENSSSGQELTDMLANIQPPSLCQESFNSSQSSKRSLRGSTSSVESLTADRHTTDRDMGAADRHTTDRDTCATDDLPQNDRVTRESISSTLGEVRRNRSLIRSGGSVSGRQGLDKSATMFIPDESQMVMGPEGGVETIGDFLSMLGIHFLHDKSRRRSSIACFSEPEPETLADYLKLGLIEPELEMYTWACEQLSTLLDKFKKLNEAKEEEIKPQLPEMFKKASAHFPDHCEMAHDLSTSCRKNVQKSFKDWRLKMLQRLYDASQDEVELLAECRQELAQRTSSVEQATETVRQGLSDLGGLSQRLTEQSAGLSLAMERLKQEEADLLIKKQKLASRQDEERRLEGKIRHTNDLLGHQGELSMAFSDELVQRRREEVERVTRCVCYSIESVERDSLTISFLDHTLILRLTMGERMGNRITDHHSDYWYPRIITDVTLESKIPVMAFSQRLLEEIHTHKLAVLGHELIMKSELVGLLRQECTNTYRLPMVILRLSWLILAVDRLMKYLRWPVAVKQRVTYTTSSISILFSSAEAKANFHVTFDLDPCNFLTSAPKVTVRRIFGRIQAAEVESLLSTIPPGPDFVKTAIQRIHYDILKTRSDLY